MTRALRLPAALVFAVIGCGKSKPPPDASCETVCVTNTPEQTDCGCAVPGPCPTSCHACSLLCIPDNTTDAGALICPGCTDVQGNCPTGCRPVG